MAAKNLTKGFSPLVSTEWLAEAMLQIDNFRLLDGSWHMPFTKRNPKTEYDEKHITKAQFFGIDDCCDKSTNFSHMLPNAKEFEKYVGNLGINNQTHVVIYDNSEARGLFSAQRVWWTFRVFGHNLVSVLDGGLPKWIREGREVTQEVETVEPVKFTANFQPHLVRSFEDVHQNLKTCAFTVLDARPKGRFDGTQPEPREGIESGHIPGSICIPASELTNPDTKVMRSPDELKKVFEAAGISLSQPVVGSCGSGISACLLALAAFQLGKEDFAVFDGSWTEYYFKSKPEERVKTAE